MSPDAPRIASALDDVISEFTLKLDVLETGLGQTVQSVGAQARNLAAGCAEARTRIRDLRNQAERIDDAVAAIRGQINGMSAQIGCPSSSAAHRDEEGTS